MKLINFIFLGTLKYSTRYYSSSSISLKWVMLQLPRQVRKKAWHWNWKWKDSFYTVIITNSSLHFWNFIKLILFIHRTIFNKSMFLIARSFKWTNTKMIIQIEEFQWSFAIKKWKNWIKRCVKWENLHFQKMIPLKCRILNLMIIMFMMKLNFHMK